MYIEFWLYYIVCGLFTEWLYMIINDILILNWDMIDILVWLLWCVW